VRREAFPLALRRPKLRDRALVAALADSDERLVRMALLELQHGVPDPILPTLVKRVVASEERSAELRALAVKVLATNQSPLVVATLVALVTDGKSIFGKIRLSSSSAQVLQALRMLARHWASHPDVGAVIQQASRSKDSDIRGAVRITSSADRSPPKPESAS
jgi:hypothetical protein